METVVSGGIRVPTDYEDIMNLPYELVNTCVMAARPTYPYLYQVRKVGDIVDDLAKACEDDRGAAIALWKRLHFEDNYISFFDRDLVCMACGDCTCWKMV